MKVLAQIFMMVFAWMLMNTVMYFSSFEAAIITGIAAIYAIVAIK